MSRPKIYPFVETRFTANDAFYTVEFSFIDDDNVAAVITQREPSKPETALYIEADRFRLLSNDSLFDEGYWPEGTPENVIRYIKELVEDVVDDLSRQLHVQVQSGVMTEKQARGIVQFGLDAFGVEIDPYFAQQIVDMGRPEGSQRVLSRA